MKKIIMLLLCAALAVSLAACGSAADGEADLHPETLRPVETAASPENSAAADVSSSDAAAEAPVSGTDADPALLSAAEDCVGQPVEALYAAIGEPDSAEYAASCLEENAEDGMLYYDGFYVWTVRTDTEELVHAVYRDE